MSLNPYDEQTAAAYAAAREIPRDELSEWRDAVRRHLHPSRGMTVVDVGARTGQFAAAFADTTLRHLTDDEFLRGKERLRNAVRAGAPQEPRSNSLGLLVLR